MVLLIGLMPLVTACHSPLAWKKAAANALIERVLQGHTGAHRPIKESGSGDAGDEGQEGEAYEDSS